jgi:hypothetical protein
VQEATIGMEEAAAEQAAAGRYLAVYLNDHLAGATGIVELVRRAAGEHAGTDLGAFLTGLAAEVAQDRRALRALMQATGTRPQVAKVAAAWAAEKAGRLKLNGRLLKPSPLSPLVELEAIETGIYGKLLLWQALRDRRPPAAGAVDLDELIARATRQLSDVERHRLAAGAALTA